MLGQVVVRIQMLNTPHSSRVEQGRTPPKGSQCMHEWLRICNQARMSLVQDAVKPSTLGPAQLNVLSSLVRIFDTVPAACLVAHPSPDCPLMAVAPACVC